MDTDDLEGVDLPLMRMEPISAVMRHPACTANPERSQERRELAGDGVGRDSTGDRSQVQHAERSVRDDRDRRTGREAQDRHDQCGTAADDDRAAAQARSVTVRIVCARNFHIACGAYRTAKYAKDKKWPTLPVACRRLSYNQAHWNPEGRIRGGNPMQTSPRIPCRNFMPARRNRGQPITLICGP